jgi:hypothetical protein
MFHTGRAFRAVLTRFRIIRNLRLEPLDFDAAVRETQSKAQLGGYIC